jgi:hypothetical protein
MDTNKHKQPAAPEAPPMPVNWPTTPDEQSQPSIDRRDSRYPIDPTLAPEPGHDINP